MATTDIGAHIVTLASTGFTLGLLHVLAGPDHLSALAALAVGTSWRAFMLGFRWGLGHSTGLVCVAIIFIGLKGDLDLRTLGRYCDTLVGIFMIGLGCYGVLGALKTFREKKAKRDPDWESSKSLVPSATSSLVTHSATELMHGSTVSTKSSSRTEIDDFNDIEKSDNNKRVHSVDVSIHTGNKHSPQHHEFDSFFHDHGDFSAAEACPFLPYVDMHDPTTQRVISFSIGLLHGVAGPGGILGVLPAVEMQNWRYSFVYLGSFILSSTLSMGAFAALYGELTKRVGATAESVELGLSVFSATLSIIVGTVWLVLSLLGKLE
eukprot:gene31734-35823_t